MVYERVETRPHRRAWSKSLVRIGAECHEESICLNRDNSAAVSLRRAHMGPTHFGQCQSGALTAGVTGVGGIERAGSSASSVRANGSRWLRKRLESRPKWRMGTTPRGRTQGKQG